MSSARRIFGLDLMRAVACLSVYVAHSCELFVVPRAQALYRPADFIGFIGVEIFFVLSGFLIGEILIRQFRAGGDRRSLWQFWIRRWFRTLPNYYLFLLIYFVIMGPLFNLPMRNPLLYPLFFQNLTGEYHEFYMHSWSLAVEEWFYLLFPLMLWFLGALSARGRDRLLVLTALFFLIGVTAARLVAVAAFALPWEEVRYITPLRLDAIMFGVLAAALKTSRPQLWPARPRFTLTLGLALFTLFATLHFVVPLESYFSRTVLFSGHSLSIALLLPFCDQWRAGERWWQEQVGRISVWSYSFYLCHLPVGFFLAALFIDVPRNGVWLDWILMATLLPISLAVSRFVYLRFELPMTGLRDRFSRAESRAEVLPAASGAELSRTHAGRVI